MARQGNGMGAAWERHAMCESAFILHSCSVLLLVRYKQQNRSRVLWMPTAVLASATCFRARQPLFIHHNELNVVQNFTADTSWAISDRSIVVRTRHPVGHPAIISSPLLISQSVHIAVFVEHWQLQATLSFVSGLLNTALFDPTTNVVRYRR